MNTDKDSWRIRAEKAEAERDRLRASVIECEDGWASHCLEQTKEAPLTKQGRAAWWATIENSVQHGNAVGCTCMMEMHATDVQRLLELIEAAEAERDRLLKMVEWLAGRCAEHCDDKGPNPRCSVAVCTIIHCNKATAEEWKEAARKSVEGK